MHNLDLSWSRDVIGQVAIGFPIGRFLLVDGGPFEPSPYL